MTQEQNRKSLPGRSIWMRFRKDRQEVWKHCMVRTGSRQHLLGKNYYSGCDLPKRHLHVLYIHVGLYGIDHSALQG